MDFSAIALVCIVGMLAYHEISTLKGKVRSLEERVNQLAELTGHDDLSSYKVSDELKEQVSQLKRNGQEVEAIKKIREQTRMDLTQAKQYVDALN